VAGACIDRYEELRSKERAVPSLSPHALERGRGQTLSILYLMSYIPADRVRVSLLCDAIVRSRSIPLLRCLRLIHYDGDAIRPLEHMLIHAARCHWEEGVREVLASERIDLLLSRHALSASLERNEYGFSFSLFDLLLRRFEAECYESIDKRGDPRRMITAVVLMVASCRDMKVTERFNEIATRRRWL
jgi:hypothetical protein